MQAIIFIGIQASGKTSFYRHRFADTHLRINLDMLKTRHREKRLLETCLEVGQAFVVDNTNPTPDERQRYILPAQEHRFQIIGYYFSSKMEDALRRNLTRPPSQQVPEKGIRGTAARLVLPSYDEGFAELYYVQLQPDSEFNVEVWNHEI